MSSLLPGYEYDIFISYRQKDNRYDGWVTEFVQNLKKELDATIKEDVSIYFDENPHDGLLETHHVDKSLERKLKCLIFIPILSRTYCDPTSYAWNQEFLPFRDQSKSDSLGPEVRLRNGNVASRILPVRIHDLEEKDKALFEKETGSVLRAVDFIFRSAGVNRPLRSKDDELKEITHTALYRDQINKAANAVSELLAAMTSTAPAESREGKGRVIQELSGVRLKKRKRFLSIASLVILVLAVVFLLNYEKWLPEPELKSIAVLPFKNLSPDPKDQYLADGFHEEVINRLYLQKNLLVIAPQSANQANLAGWGPAEIGARLKVQYLLSGSVQKSGDNLKITTQLTDARNGQVLYTKTLERKLNDYFILQGEVSMRVVSDVGITMSGGLRTYHSTTDNLKAWEYFKQSSKYSPLSDSKNITDTLVHLLQLAIHEDSLFLQAWSVLEFFHFYKYDANGDSINLKAGMVAMEKINAIDHDSYIAKRSEMLYVYYVQKDFEEVVRKADALLRIVPYHGATLSRKALALRRLGRYQEFIEVSVQRLKVDPLNIGTKREVAWNLVAQGQTREARKFLGALKGTALTADYYFLSFNNCILEGGTDCMDSLLAEAEVETHKQFDVQQQREIRLARNRIVSFYSRDYTSVLGQYTQNNANPWSWASLDSAILQRLLGDSLSSKSSFLKAKAHLQKIFNKGSGSQLSLHARIRYAVCKSGLGEDDWESEFMKLKVDVIHVMSPQYYNGYVLASLLAGQNEKALRLLGEWKTTNVPFPLVNEYAGPFELLFLKNHPLLDPIRLEPGFEELWEGNHLKIKPLKVPED